MSAAVQYYITTLAVYFGVNIIACLGLNLQFGIAGLVDFAFILFQAIGAYTASVLTLGPASSNGGFQHYVLGARLPFPLPILAGGLVAGVLALGVGMICLRRLRADYQAIAFLAVAFIASTIVTNQVNLFNGATGLSLVPQPLSGTLNLSTVAYAWVYVGITFAFVAVTWVAVQRIDRAPLGRALRAGRESEIAAESIGKNVARNKLLAFVAGSVVAGMSGALLVEFITAWSPSGWETVETFVYFAAVIIGGAGNNFGAIAGAAIVPLAILEGTQFIPGFGHIGVVEQVQWIVIGLLVAAFLWVRPIGILPERRRRFASRASARSKAPPGSSRAADPTPTIARLSNRRQGGSGPLLDVADLHKHFGGVQAVAGTSMVVERGTITGLIGPNGAGKSTALAVIAGAEKPTRGKITFGGVDVTSMPAYKRARRGVIRTFQLGGEFPRLTVLDNVIAAAPGQHGESYRGALFGQRRWKRQQEELLVEARGLLQRFDLSEKEREYAGNLSGGQKRLLELARALMAKPVLLLLDEPMAGVNPVLARRIEQHLVELREGGLTILLVEHELGVVERVCDHTIVMAEGRVISQGTMAIVRTDQEVLDAYLGR